MPNRALIFIVGVVAATVFAIYVYNFNDIFSGRGVGLKDEQRMETAESAPLMIHELINKERAKAGLAALQYDDGIAMVAKLHSQDMAKRKYFEHVTPERLSPSDRAKQQGLTCGLGENIYTIHSSDNVIGRQLTESAVEGWMNSPGHRANILYQNYRFEGLGIAYLGQDAYVTENFAVTTC